MGAGRRNPPPRDRCFLFDVTSYNICGPFVTYWHNNGGVERVNFSITPMFREQVEGEGYYVQHFERRLEWHSNSGTPYETLLGLLGRDIYRSLPCAPIDDQALQRTMRGYLRDLGCPNRAVRATVPAVGQEFERASMFWVAGTSSAPPMIIVLYAPPNETSMHWQVFTDTYIEGKPVGSTAASPPGRAHTRLRQDLVEQPGYS